MSLDFTGPLRDALVAADFTYDGVAGLLGEAGHRALSRNETTPGAAAYDRRRPARHPDPAVPAPGAGVPRGGRARRCPASSTGSATPACSSRAWARWRRGSTAGPTAPTRRTSGSSPTSRPASTARPTGSAATTCSASPAPRPAWPSSPIREPVGRALDLGTGCGVQALHLAAHAGEVVATDVNTRALWMTRLNAALNEVDVDVREGSFFEPLRGERFDLIATNPPFVISPATGERLVYRDSGLPGDRVVEDIVRAGARAAHRGRLVPGPGQLGHRARPAVGRAARRRGWTPTATPWSCSARSSTRASTSSCGSRTPGCTAATTTSAATTPGCRGSTSRASRGSASAGSTCGAPVAAGTSCSTGPTTSSSPSARRSPSGAPPSAPRSTEADHLVARPDLLQETQGRPGAEDPSTIVLRQQRGLRRARQVDTARGGLRRGLRRRAVGRPDRRARWPSCSEQDVDDVRRDVLPLAASWSAEGFLVAGPREPRAGRAGRSSWAASSAARPSTDAVAAGHPAAAAPSSSRLCSVRSGRIAWYCRARRTSRGRRRSRGTR